MATVIVDSVPHHPKGKKKLLCVDIWTQDILINDNIAILFICYEVKCKDSNVQ
jgi:hypothetical protein